MASERSIGVGIIGAGQFMSRQHVQTVARSLPVAVGFNRRFAPATQLLAQAFATSGPPVSVLYRISDDDRALPPEQRWKKEDRLLIETVHILDLLTYPIGGEPLGVYACQTRWNDVLVTLEFDNGSRAMVLSSSWGSLAQVKEHMEAVLGHAALEMNDFVGVRTFGITGGPAVARFATAILPTPTASAWAAAEA